MWSGSRQSLDCRERFLVWFFFWDFLGFWEHLHCWISQPRSCRVWSSPLRRTGSKDLTQEVPRDTQECPFGSLQTPGEVQKLLREVWDSPEWNPPEAGAAPLIPSHKFQPWRDLPAAQTSPFSPQECQAGLCSAAAAAQSRICYLGPFPRNHKNSQIQEKAPRPFPRGFSWSWQGGVSWQQPQHRAHLCAERSLFRAKANKIKKSHFCVSGLNRGCSQQLFPAQAQLLLLNEDFYPKSSPLSCSGGWG